MCVFQLVDAFKEKFGAEQKKKGTKSRSRFPTSSFKKKKSQK